MPPPWAWDGTVEKEPVKVCLLFTVRFLGVSVNQSQYRMAALGRTQANAQNHKQASAELFHTNTNCTLYWYKTHKERHIAGHTLGTMKFGTSHIYSLPSSKRCNFLVDFVTNKSYIDDNPEMIHRWMLLVCFMLFNLLIQHHFTCFPVSYLLLFMQVCNSHRMNSMI